MILLLLSYAFYRLFRWMFVWEIAMHPAAKATFKQMVKKFQQESMFCEPCETTVIEVRGDDDLAPDGASKDIKCVRASRRVPYAVRVAHLAKAQVGLLANTKSNELVYARICREEMIKHAVRPSHIAHMVPLAVAACFIPLDSDYLAASIRQSKQMKKRVGLLGPLFSNK
jgi:hypothetical protein